MKSGAEEFIMGNTKVEVNQNQTIAIVVSLLLFVCSNYSTAPVKVY